MRNIKNYKFEIIIFLTIIALSIYSAPARTFNINDNISINKTELKQGDILVVKTAKEININQIKFNGNQYQTKKYEQGKIAVIPISYWTNAGNYELEIIKDDRNITTPINIISGNFTNSYLQVDKDQEELIKPEKEATIKRKKEDQKMINQARKNSRQAIIFNNNFIWPVDGIISTDFGATRFVNGELQSRHSGIDIAADKGTPVLAANGGIVKLAAHLLVTGNTIIIDHGFNIFSSYSHLSKLDVNKGEQVKKGEKIGEIGSTGFSTGPHLHWTITVGRVFVNPRNFVEKDILK